MIALLMAGMVVALVAAVATDRRWPVVSDACAACAVACLILAAWCGAEAVVS